MAFWNLLSYFMLLSIKSKKQKIKCKLICSIILIHPIILCEKHALTSKLQQGSFSQFLSFLVHTDQTDSVHHMTVYQVSQWSPGTRVGLFKVTCTFFPASPPLYTLMASVITFSQICSPPHFTLQTHQTEQQSAKKKKKTTVLWSRN